MSKVFVEINNPTHRDYHDGKQFGDWERISSYEGIRIHDGSYSQAPANYRSSRDLNFDAHPGMVVYPVIVVYSTGDTFGRSSGEVKLVDIFDTAEKARGLEEAIRANSERSPRSYTFYYEDVEYYAEWEGYFENLDRVIVEAEVVRA